MTSGPTGYQRARAGYQRKVTMLKQLLQGAVLKRLAAKTPMGAAAMIGGSWYLRHRKAKKAQQAGMAR
ncbi:hypothetical protein GCM10020369_85070 [Cryptosporangium minutisporangium]|uniref:Uncharacterized protein n=1 Tax=Cryptosporangium minutisporangium TaxID=113569 RepID=A0ABP6TCJ0_9ACTN